MPANACELVDLCNSHKTVVVVVRPHRRTTYVDTVCCYRRSSVVCLSVYQSVCRSVAIVNPAKTAEPIEMSFGLWTRVGTRSIINLGVHIDATW